MIVDDEAPAREGLRLRLKREADVVVLGEFGDAERALNAIATDPPDLVFLDIQMPGMDGFQLMEKGSGLNMPPVVFVTAHDKHAVEAFGARALDYLLKPVEQERLHESLERAREYWALAQKGEIADRVRAALGEGEYERKPARPSQRIPVKVNSVIKLIEPDEIDYIDAAGDSVRIHTGKTTHLLRKSMGEMLTMLDTSRFVRIHRSTIVNVDRVVELQPYFHGEYVVVMKDGTRLKLSRGFRDQIVVLTDRSWT
jgi:two-component system LytT family response regulator